MKTALAVIGLAVLAGCARPTGANLDPSLTLLIPADTTTLVCIRLDLLKTAPVYQKYFANRDIPQVNEFAKTTGVDVKRNLWELLFVSNGTRNMVLGRGMFSDESEPRLDNLTKQGAKRFAYKGVNFVGDDQHAVMLLSQTVVGVGDTAMLKQAVDAKDTSSGPPPALAALLKDTPHEAQVWAAYTGGPITLPFETSGNLANVGKLMGLLQRGSAYLDMRMGLKGLVTTISANQADSQQIEGAVKALLGLARLSTPANDKDRQRVWDGFRVTQEGVQTKVYIDQPEDLVERLIDLVPGQGR
jgi:hypothetical protein